MRIEFVYGPFSSGGKTFDFSNLYDDSQGLTGSEYSIVEFARAMAARGHEITLYIPCKNSLTWNNVRIKNLNEFGLARQPPDVVYSWNEPDMLEYCWEGSLRMVNQQLNDFGYTNPKNFKCVDIFTSPSPSHKEYIKQFTSGHEHKWQVISNCYNPEMFARELPKKRGNCIWASSVDRGLHLLLEQWPKIKQAVPHATLDIYYPFDHWVNSLQNVNESSSEFWREFKQRADYIVYALNAMKEGFGITHHKAVSKKEISKAFLEADIFPYSCSTVASTEGFSVSTLEAMAAGCVPILSTQDSLGQIYAPSGCPMIPTPTINHMDKFVYLTIEALTNEKWANSVREKTKKFAENFTFQKEAIKLEQMMFDGLNKKR